MRGLGRPQKTFIVRRIRFGVTSPLIEINPVKSGVLGSCSALPCSLPPALKIHSLGVSFGLLSPRGRSSSKEKKGNVKIHLKNTMNPLKIPNSRNPGVVCPSITRPLPATTVTDLNIRKTTDAQVSKRRRGARATCLPAFNLFKSLCCQNGVRKNVIAYMPFVGRTCVRVCVCVSAKPQIGEHDRGEKERKNRTAGGPMCVRRRQQPRSDCGGDNAAVVLG